MMIQPILIILNFLALSPTLVALDDAESLYKQGKADEAFASATSAAEQALSASDTVSLIKAYCLLAGMAIDGGEDLKAVDYYNKCADISLYCEPMFMLSSSLYNIATIYYQNGENEKALEYITKSILIDSRRESDSILALRYLLAAEILFKQGEYDRAIEMVAKGRKCAKMNNNNNVEARLMLLKAKCREAKAGSNPDWKAIEEEYRSALDTLKVVHKGHYYGAVSPYAPEFLYHIGLAVAAQGGNAKEYFEEAIAVSSRSQKMLGVNPMVEIKSCKALADIFVMEGNAAGAQPYLDKAEKLSYFPYVREMGNKLSLSQMEFIRKEKEMEIQNQKEKALFLLVIVSVLSAAIICLLLMYRHQLHQKREIWEKNTQLVKLNLQKDNLITMLQENEVYQKLNEEIEAIAKDSIPYPDIKLSKREREVVEYCCKGLISKEIAAEMGVSVRTVESHKLNIFHKVGVNTTNELIAFAFKARLIK